MGRATGVGRGASALSGSYRCPRVARTLPRATAREAEPFPAAAELPGMTRVTAAGGPRIAGGLRAAGALSAVLLAVLTGTLTLLVPATPAQAHAAMVAATPVPGTVLGASPTEITVTFSEAVTVGDRQGPGPGTGRETDQRYRASERQHPAHPGTACRPAARHVPGQLPGDLRRTATRSPVAFTFSVGAPSAVAPQQPKDERAPLGGGRAAGGTATLGYAGLVLAIGPALFLALLWPRRLSRRGPVRLVRAGLALIALSTAGGTLVAGAVQQRRGPARRAPRARARRRCWRARSAR